MAKVVAETPEVIVPDWRWEYLKLIGVGAIIGIVWWTVSALIRHYIVDAPDIAGNIAHVVIGVVGVVALLRLDAARPLIVAVATAGVLWGLGGFLQGLSWYEALAWAVGFFIFSYLLFSIIARFQTLALSLLLSLGIVLITRIALAL